MGKFLDRTGLKYGRLTVIKHNGKDHRNKHLWLCKCDCGNEKVVVSDNLSSDKSNSCGCLKKEFLANSGFQFRGIEDREKALLKVQYSHLKRRNKKMQFGDVIDFETFAGLSKSPCKYCGLKNSKEIEDRYHESKKNKRLSDHILKCNGIDRVDNKKGYTKENSVACCKDCNFAKYTMTEDSFYEWIKRVYEHLFCGTTGIAALNTNRNAILIEREPEYCEIIKKRIAEAEQNKANSLFAGE